jgi:hypothetical protein
MIDAVDSELRERFAALRDQTDDSSWEDVSARTRASQPRRKLRTPLAIAAAVALAVAVATPAVGLPGRIVRLFKDAQPATPQVAKSFSDFDKLVSSDLAAPPRRVLETQTGPGQTATLWAAPTTSGGFCTLVKLQFPDGSSDGAGGECEARLRRLSVDVTLHGPFSPEGAVLGGPVLVKGFVGQPDADSLHLEFQDGDMASIPLVWVSRPVEMAFFVYGVPERHWHAGHLPTRLTVRTASGKELAHAEISGIPAS